MVRPVQERTLQLVMKNMRAARLPEGASIADFRAYVDGMARVFSPKGGVACTHGDVYGVPVEIQTPPASSPNQRILYLHGGGYCFGSPSSHRHLTTRLAAHAACELWSVDYRLAPEHPFPAALEDVRGVYRFLLEQGHAPEDVVLAGDSAGGGLALSLLKTLRDAAMPLPGAAVLLSPWTDLAAEGGSVEARAERDPLIRPEDVRRFAAMYLDGKPLDHPIASPLHGDLRQLPPLLVHVGTEEVLYDDAVELEARAQQAGVACTCYIGEGLPHVWHYFTPLLPQANQAIRDIAAFLKSRNV